MSIRIQDIQAPIETEMKLFEQKFRSFMSSKVFLLDKITHYIVKRKGKQIRPLFVFLMAGALGKITEKTHRGAALIELLHTATLVHDDVVDDSLYRRNFFSINALWKNKIAVLVGDYLLSRGLLLSVDNGDFDLLQLVSTAVREMSEGELLQIAKARKLDITEEVYFEVIRQKTASLIAACCAVGVCSAGADTATQEKAKAFGEKVGITFQIKDDLFDYGTSEIGKPLGIDIKEKKMTLPLIYALSKASWLERQKIILTIKTQSHKPTKVAEVIAFVKEKGGIEYATIKMYDYLKEATEMASFLPENIYKRSLMDLLKFTVEREK